MTLRIKLLVPLAFMVAMALPATGASARNYDCSKAGNANKAVCKGAATPKPAAAPAAARPAASATSTRNYDCTKAGNANKTVCKGAAKPVAAAPAPRAAPTQRAAAPVATASHGQATHPGGPQGSTARCNDNTYSHSQTRSGTCSRHGGVAQWY